MKTNNIYFEYLDNNKIYFSLEENQYFINNNTININSDKLIEGDFNIYDKIIFTQDNALIIKITSELINAIPLSIDENIIIQTKNLSAKHFTLNSDFLVNKLNYLASNRLDLAYFKKFVLAYELNKLDINYQELLYLLKNRFVRFFQFRINNILITKINSDIMQICLEDNSKVGFDAYEAYSYYLNIDDFFKIYQQVINPELLELISDVSQHSDETIYLKALNSKYVFVALLKLKESLIYKSNGEIYYSKR